MDKRRNYYQILYVQPDAPDAIIRSSYRILMQQLKQHPDLGGDHLNAVIINEAFEVLHEAGKRTEYDRVLFGDAAGDSPDLRWIVPGQPLGSGEKHTCLFCGYPQLPLDPVDAQAECPLCSSPLTAARPLLLEAEGQRMLRRMEKEGPMAFSEHWPGPRFHAGKIRNLSPNGIQFSAAVFLAVNTIIKIESPVVAAVATIAYRKSNPHQGAPMTFIYGARFHTLRFKESCGTFLSEVV